MLNFGKISQTTFFSFASQKKSLLKFIKPTKKLNKVLVQCFGMNNE